MLLEDTLAAGFAALGVTPDSGAAARYRIYFEHLEKMNAVMNLTAISGEEDVARLHFLDCAALLGMADFRGFDDVRCIHARAEEAPTELHAGFDIACSRAVARLNLLCELCLPLAKKGGAFIAMKGPDCADELNAAKRAIKLLGGEVEDVKKYLVPGTDATHSAIIIRKTADTPAKYPRRWAQIKKQPL